MADAPCHYWQLDGRTIGKGYLSNPRRSHTAMRQIGEKKENSTNLIHGKEAREAGVENKVLVLLMWHGKTNLMLYTK